MQSERTGKDGQAVEATMKQGNPADPFEKGDPLKDRNFSKYWFQIFIIMIVILIVISGVLWAF